MPVPSDGTRGKDQNSARKWPQVCQLHAYSPETGSEAFWYRRLPRKENISLHEEQTNYHEHFHVLQTLVHSYFTLMFQNCAYEPLMSHEKLHNHEWIS